MVHRKIQLRPITTNQTNHILFVDRELSKANHQLFRQSRNYTCKIDLDADVVNQVVDVYAISPTWMNMQAYRMAYEKFKENSKEESGNIARWNDFRVKPGFATSSDFGGGGFTDFSTVFTFYPSGEYLYSEVHDASGNPRSFVWVGATSSSQYNIIDEYDLKANTDASPSSPINTVPYDDLSDEYDDGQKDHLENDGNNPPYAASTLPNQCFTKIATLTANAGAAPGDGKLSTGYFQAPSGIIVIKTSANLASDADALTLEVKAGDYKGVFAPDMLGGMK